MCVLLPLPPGTIHHPLLESVCFLQIVVIFSIFKLPTVLTLHLLAGATIVALCSYRTFGSVARIVLGDDDVAGMAKFPRFVIYDFN